MTQVHLTTLSATVPSATEGAPYLLGAASTGGGSIRIKQTVNGPTSPLKLTNGSVSTDGASQVAWYSIPFPTSVTITQGIVWQGWCLEVTDINTAPAMGIYRCDGNGAELATIVAPTVNLGAGELSSGGYAIHTITASTAVVTDTTFSVGDRLKLALFIDDAVDQGGVGNMVTGSVARFGVYGGDASFAESKLIFSDYLPFLDLNAYEPTWLPAEAIYGQANHYGYEPRDMTRPEYPKTSYPAATGGTTYPVEQ